MTGGMTKLIRAARGSMFVRHNAIFFGGAVLVGALNYAYYPILGRLLDPAPFGEVQALVSLFLQLAIFLTVLGLVTVNISANYEDQAKRNEVIFELEKLALLLSLGLLVLAIIFSNQLRDFFRFDDSLPFVILLVTLVITVPLTFRSSFVRGKQKFGLVSLANIVAAGAKIVCSWVLVAAGLGTAGAILGVAFAQGAALALVAFWAARFGLRRTADAPRWRLPRFDTLAPELKYAGLVLICSLVVTAQFSIDVVIIKHYFDAHTAGLYAGVAAVARIIFFLTASIAQVMMPSIKLKQTEAQNQRILMKSLVLHCVVSLPCVVIFTLMPEQVIRLLMGTEYITYANLLPPLGMMVFIVSVVNLLVAYYMSLRQYGVAIITVIGAGVTYALIGLHHETLQAVVNGLLYGSLIMLGLAACWEGWRLAKRRWVLV